jgi:hypothetical protein
VFKIVQPQTGLKILGSAMAGENFKKSKRMQTDTQQAILLGDMVDGIVYIRPPYWWPDPVP